MSASLVERIGLALVKPRSALAIAGDRRHAGRSGSDLLVAILVLLAATQLRTLVAGGWLGVAVDSTLGVRAIIQTLTDALVVDLGFLVIGAVAIYAASGAKRELGRAFDLACVAALPLLFVDLAASTVVVAAELTVPRTLMWVLSSIAYAWTAMLVAIAIGLVRRGAEPTAERKVARRAGWAITALALVGVVVQVVWLVRHLELVRPMTPGDPAPAFTLPRITGTDQLGEPVSLTEARGKVVVLDFWATWCGPCIKALPKLDAIARRHPDVAVLAINIDDANAAWQLFEQSKYVMTLLAGDQMTSNRYGVSAIPHTVVIDRSGRVRRVFRGSTHAIEREVASLLR